MRQFLLGTDWWTDCDDAVALRLLARAVKRGEIRLLGVAINACMEQSVASLTGFLKAEGIEGVPVGLDSEAIDFGGRLTYQMRLASELAPDVTNADAEDPVRLYRRLLAEATEPVEILEIGFLQVVAALLKSGADDISEKSGLELVREKVSKFWVMAGKWDADGEKENNFCRNGRSREAGKIFCELCPVPVTFLGFEVGYGVISGGKLREDDFLHHVLVDHGSRGGRHSWDPMLVLMALIGDEEAAGYTVVAGVASVDAETGKNYFVRDHSGKHKFVIKQRENRFYEEQINAGL
ncbi:MAG: hypothetical protein J6D16_07340 [Clostridia bacterium]|nr:hypothetical protein [Clostridia bacterium]